MPALFIHLGISFIWLFMNSERNLATFMVGLVIGFALLYQFRKMLRSTAYIRRLIGLFLFVFFFVWQFCYSNIIMIVAVLTRPREKIVSNFIVFDISDLNEAEIYILSQCLTLTPGTTAIAISKNHEELMVHAFDAKDPDKIRSQIDQGFKRAILRFTR